MQVTPVQYDYFYVFVFTSVFKLLDPHWIVFYDQENNFGINTLIYGEFYDIMQVNFPVKM